MSSENKVEEEHVDQEVGGGPSVPETIEEFLLSYGFELTDVDPGKFATAKI